MFDGATQIGTAPVNSSGAWSYTTSALSDGSHGLTATVTNASGQTSTASAALAVKIDTTAPNAPTIGTPSANTSGGADSQLAAANSTMDTNGGVTLTAEANSAVKVFDGTTQIGTATANGSGAWSYATANLTTGSHSFTAKAMDAAGNTGTASAAAVVNIRGADPGPFRPHDRVLVRQWQGRRRDRRMTVRDPDGHGGRQQYREGIRRRGADRRCEGQFKRLVGYW